MHTKCMPWWKPRPEAVMHMASITISAGWEWLCIFGTCHIHAMSVRIFLLNTRQIYTLIMDCWLFAVAYIMSSIYNNTLFLLTWWFNILRMVRTMSCYLKQNVRQTSLEYFADNMSCNVYYCSLSSVHVLRPASARFVEGSVHSASCGFLFLK